MREEVTTYSESLGQLQGDVEIITRRPDAGRRSHAESPHTQAKDPCEEQHTVRILRSSVGRI